jgi:polyferredoxin
MPESWDAAIARRFAMSDAVWRRHANPWSVYTRMTALPLLALAVWSRAWLGWWSLLPLAAVLAAIWLNPRVFPEPRSTDNWASRVVEGERIWLKRRTNPVPPHHRLAPHLLGLVSFAGLPFLVWGLWALAIWPTAVGLLLAMGGKLWFADRMAWLRRDAGRAEH